MAPPLVAPFPLNPESETVNPEPVLVPIAPPLRAFELEISAFVKVRLPPFT